MSVEAEGEIEGAGAGTGVQAKAVCGWSAQRGWRELLWVKCTPNLEYFEGEKDELKNRKKVLRELINRLIPRIRVSTG